MSSTDLIGRKIKLSYEYLYTVAKNTTQESLWILQYFQLLWCKTFAMKGYIEMWTSQTLCKHKRAKDDWHDIHYLKKTRKSMQIMKHKPAWHKNLQKDSSPRRSNFHHLNLRYTWTVSPESNYNDPGTFFIILNF